MTPRTKPGLTRRASVPVSRTWPRPSEGAPISPTSRDRRSRLVAVAALSLILITAVGACGAPAQTGTRDQPPAAVQSAAPDDRSQPPWPAPADVTARVAAAGLDLGPMGTAEHYHPHLRVIVHGSEVPVPPDIGVDPATGAMSALHTHEPDGTLHIEADRIGEAFTLGQLFTQWGITLTATQVGGVQAQDGQQVTLTSNGTAVTGDPARLRLEPDQQIVLELP